MKTDLKKSNNEKIMKNLFEKEFKEYLYNF